MGFTRSALRTRCCFKSGTDVSGRSSFVSQSAQQAKRGHGSEDGRWSKRGGEARSKLNGGLSGILVKRVTEGVI
jgi:hypothetical protein